MDGSPAADPRPTRMRLLAAIHFGLLGFLLLYAVPFIGQPCDDIIEPGCPGTIGLGAMIGLLALGAAVVIAACLAIRALFDRPSPLVIADAFVGAGYAPAVVALPLAPFGALLVLTLVGVAALAIAGLVVAASDVAGHVVERWVAIAGLTGIALLFASTRTSGTTIAVLVPLLGIAALVVGAALGPRRPKRAV